MDPVVAQAEHQWLSAGLGPALQAVMATIRFNITTLSGSEVGETLGTNILIDRNAAGYGWFVDGEQVSDEDFGIAETPTDRLAGPGSPAYQKVDLLTVLEHEIGHALGLGDSTDPGTAHDVMYLWLSLGERRLVSASDAEEVNASTLMSAIEFSVASYSPLAATSRNVGSVADNVASAERRMVAGVDIAQLIGESDYSRYIAAMNGVWRVVKRNIPPVADDEFAESDLSRFGQLARL